MIRILLFILFSASPLLSHTAPGGLFKQGTDEYYPTKAEWMALYLQAHTLLNKDGIRVEYSSAFRTGIVFATIYHPSTVSEKTILEIKKEAKEEFLNFKNITPNRREWNRIKFYIGTKEIN